jgi:dihydropyrimidine dehydrogenase (NAD+) subunit PreA
MAEKPELSGIGGIESWRDALEFIQLGCSNVQVCTAVIQYGCRIVCPTGAIGVTKRTVKRK